MVGAGLALLLSTLVSPAAGASPCVGAPDWQAVTPGLSAPALQMKLLDPDQPDDFPVELDALGMQQLHLLVRTETSGRCMVLGGAGDAATFSLSPPPAAPGAALPAPDRRRAQSLRFAYEDAVVNGQLPAPAARSSVGADLSALRTGLGPTSTTFSASDLRIVRAYGQVLSFRTDDQFHEFLRDHHDGLDKAEYLVLVQMVGGRAFDDYDGEREGLNFSPAVTPAQIIWAARTNLRNPGASKSAGVCRDIASMQASMLEDHDFPHTYVVAFEHGPYHVTTLTTDPDDPHLVYRFDYDALYVRKDLDGSLLLFQDAQDLTVSYHLFRPTGGSVAVTPSELGKVASEAAGFELSALDPLARTNHVLGGVALALGSDAPAHLRAIDGVDGLGARYHGFGADLAYGTRSIAPGQVGVFLGDMLRPAASAGTFEETGALISYLQWQQSLRTPQAALGAGWSVGAEARNTLIGSGAKARAAGVLQPPEGQADERLNLEGHLDQHPAASRFHATYRAGVEVGPGLSDIRDLSSIVPAMNHVYVDAVPALTVGRVTWFADALTVADQVQARARLQAGAALGHWTTSAELSGRLLTSMPLYEDSSIRRAGLNVRLGEQRGYALAGSASTELEGPAPVRRAQLLASFDFD